MLWSIVLFYEAMCIAGFLTYFLVAITKEVTHYVRTDDNRIERMSDYFRRNYGIGFDSLTKQDYANAAVKFLLAGWFYGMLCLNEYYVFLEYDAEQQKEKA